jgi:hypothetical protein
MNHGQAQKHAESRVWLGGREDLAFCVLSLVVCGSFESALARQVG